MRTRSRSRIASRTAALTASAALLVACTVEDGEPREQPPGEVPSSGAASETPAPTPTPTPSSTPSPEPTTAPAARVSPDDLRVATAVEAVKFLAGEVGPRPGHTPAYFRAATWAERELTRSGWSVERQRFPTPAGVSWGVPVEAGPSVNLLATRGDLEPGEPWVLVGAHLDTVPQAPGAEDNASGVGVVLTVAEALQDRRTRLPVVLALFGSEEPRGPSDDEHHYGSRAYVASLAPAERRSLRAMVSLDRVGVGGVVPVGSPAEPNTLTDALVAAADRVDVPTEIDVFQRSSDHWSFARDGLPGARLGSTPYAGYHDESDLPGVVDRAQLERVGRLVLSWLA